MQKKALNFFLHLIYYGTEMIPLFCFFPSLAAKQKKKETAKGDSS